MAESVSGGQDQPLSEILRAVALELGHQQTASLAVERVLGDVMSGGGGGALSAADMAACQNLDKLSQSLGFLSSYIDTLAASVPPDARAAVAQGAAGDTFVSIRNRLADATPGAEDDEIELFAAP